MAIINQEKLLAQLQSDLELLEQLRELFLEECAELLEFLLEWQDEQGEPVDPDMLDVSPSLAPASADD